MGKYETIVITFYNFWAGGGGGVKSLSSIELSNYILIFLDFSS